MNKQQLSGLEILEKFKDGIFPAPRLLKAPAAVKSIAASNQRHI